MTTTLSLLNTFPNTQSDSQIIYRLLLDSLSKPGTIADVPTALCLQEENYLPSSVWAIAQTLFDADTKVYVSAMLANDTVLQSLSFHTNAVVVSEQLHADFAIIPLSELNTLDDFMLGDIAKPHKSSTVLVVVDALSHGESLYLQGPGIEVQRAISIASMSDQQITLLRANHELYPCGVDFIFCAPQQWLALPRSTVVSCADEAI